MDNPKKTTLTFEDLSNLDLTEFLERLNQVPTGNLDYLMNEGRYYNLTNQTMETYRNFYQIIGQDRIRCGEIGILETYSHPTDDDYRKISIYAQYLTMNSYPSPPMRKPISLMKAIRRFFST